MKRIDTTRRVEDMRHYNDQNPNVNPGRTRSRAPRMVRQEPYSGQVRTIMVAAPEQRTADRSGRQINGAPLPIAQRQGAKKYE